MRPGDRIYACLPLFHINSQAYSTMGAIGAEGAIVLAPRFSAQPLLARRPAPPTSPSSTSSAP